MNIKANETIEIEVIGLDAENVITESPPVELPPVSRP